VAAAAASVAVAAVASACMLIAEAAAIAHTAAGGRRSHVDTGLLASVAAAGCGRSPATTHVAAAGRGRSPATTHAAAAAAAHIDKPLRAERALGTEPRSAWRQPQQRPQQRPAPAASKGAGRRLSNGRPQQRGAIRGRGI
jgi:hypothetical protein